MFNFPARWTCRTPLSRALFFRSLHATSLAASRVKLVAELRKRTQVSLNKAREALDATGNDTKAALAWIEKDMEASGIKKAEKLEGRIAEQGVIGTVVLSDGSVPTQSLRAAMIELNCETDFVARNGIFYSLAINIAHTLAFYADSVQTESNPTATAGGTIFHVSPRTLDDGLIVPHPMDNSPTIPTIGSTVSSSIRDTMTKLGEKISLQRAAVLTSPPMIGLRLGSFTHDNVASSSSHAQAGRIASLVTLGVTAPSPSTGQVPTNGTNLNKLLVSKDFLADFAKLSRSAARQVVGMETSSINHSEPIEGEDGIALYNQEALMFQRPDVTVRHVLREWADARGILVPNSVEVMELLKWKIGERSK